MIEIESVSALLEDLHSRYGENCIPKAELIKALDSSDRSWLGAEASLAENIDLLVEWELLEWEQEEQGYFLSPEVLEWLDAGRLAVELALLWSSTMAIDSTGSPASEEADWSAQGGQSENAVERAASGQDSERGHQDGTLSSLKGRTIPWGQMAIGMWMMTIFLALYTIYESTQSNVSSEAEKVAPDPVNELLDAHTKKELQQVLDSIEEHIDTVRQ